MWLGPWSPGFAGELGRIAGLLSLFLRVFKCTNHGEVEIARPAQS
jgi:hypothetical protein